jgi:sphingomyelin phosphodiesterase
MKAFIIILLIAFAIAGNHGTRKNAGIITAERLGDYGDIINTIGLRLLENQQKAKDGHSVVGYERELGFLWQNPITCGQCYSMLNKVDFFINNPIVRPALEWIAARTLCTDELEVCVGAVKEMGDIIVPQIFEHLFAPKYACSRMLGFCSNPSWKTLDDQEYIDRVLADKPDFIKDNEFTNNKYKEIKADPKERKAVRVMHLSDIHLDFDYVEGTNKNCNEPVCCRTHVGLPPTPEDAAGKYGSLADCDLPVITAHMAFDYMRDLDVQPDLIFWTGDNTAHDIWNQSVKENVEYTVKISEWLQTHLDGVPVFPVPGNHEFYPVNVMKFDGTDEILPELAKVWEKWLSADANESFAKYGYYTMPLSGVKESWNGFRVIALNTEVCNGQNWYLMSQDNDPIHMLEWVEGVFKETELNNEKAYVIGHVQTGISCLNSWSTRYRALLERYQHIIVGHFFGHGHEETFNVVTDTKNQSFINVLHQPGSLTTYSGHNPQFRMLDIDYETGLPVKSYKHFFNITGADMGDPKWELQYEYTEEYEMVDFSPESFHNLTLRFRDEVGPASQYRWNKGGRTHPIEHYNCDGVGCRHGQYCESRNFMSREETDCNGGPHFDFKNNLEGGFTEMVFDVWVEKTD